MATDVEADQLIINFMDAAEYEAAEKVNDQLYLVEAVTTYMYKTYGTLTQASSSIPLGVVLQSIDQIVLVNLDMGVALPSTYTLSEDKANLVFTETLDAGTNWSVVYASILDSGVAPSTYITTVSGTTERREKYISLGFELTSASQILSVNVGNTIILPTLYHLDEDNQTLALDYYIEEGEMYSVQILQNYNLDALPIASTSNYGVAKVAENGGIISNNGALSIDQNKVLPNQSGNAGKFLTTDGTNASWQEGSFPTITYWEGNY